MRAIPSAELALWTHGDLATRELRVRVKRPEEASFTNLSATLGGDWVLGVRSDGDTPDQPAGRFVLRFLKHASEGSLSPGLSAAPINRDASNVFRPLIHPGRHVEVDVRVSTEPWRLWLKGQIEDVDWAGSEAVATCLTLDGVILATQIEEEAPRGAPDPGTAVEVEIQGLLTAWMDSPPTLVTVGTPGWGVGPYIPPLGSLGEQIRALAQRNSWDVRYRWNEAAGDYRLTLYLPPRDKTVADFALGLELMQAVAGLRVSRQYVRNAIVVEYVESGAAKRITRTDPASITEYGRRAMVIRELAPDSPITTSAQAAALGDYAISDLARPLADGRYRIPFLPWLELHDLLALQADDDHYDFDTDFAIVGISHVVEPEGGWWTEVDLRGGKPAGAFYSWHARSGRAPAREEEYGLPGFRYVQLSTEETRFLWDRWGTQVSEIRVFLGTYPRTSSTWPETTGDPTALLLDRAADLSYEVDHPPPGYITRGYLVPLLENGQPGEVYPISVQPTADPPDVITAITATVNQEDGSVPVRIEVAARTASVRYAWAAGNPAPPWPADATVEGGEVAVPTSGIVAFTLPPGTVGYKETFRIRAAPYRLPGGLGTDGATDHGEIRAAEDIRLPPPVSLEETTLAETDTQGTLGVTVRDPGGFATHLYRDTKAGDAPWVVALETAAPVDGAEYLASVALIEGHQSHILWRLRYVRDGKVGWAELPCAFDKGAIPNVPAHLIFDLVAGTAEVEWKGDSDTRSVKVHALTTGMPNAADVRATAPRNGRTGRTGPLISGLTAGQMVHAAILGYSQTGGGGKESSELFTMQAKFGIGAPAHTPASINAAALTLANRAMVADLLFTADDHDTVSWAAGAIRLADGTSYSVDAGTTGNMTAQTWLYLDTAVSTTALQATTTLASAIGEGKLLVAYARPASSTDFKALVVPVGGKPSINAETITGITLNVIQAVVDDLSAINANFSGTVTGAAIVAAESFTAALATFEHDVFVKEELRLYGPDALLTFYEIISGTLTRHGGIVGDNRTLLISGGDNGVQLGDAVTAKLGFNGKTPIAKPVVSGTRTGTLAQLQTVVGALLQALEDLGIINDTTT